LHVHLRECATMEAEQLNQIAHALDGIADRALAMRRYL
jgi:hypothetical protein